MSLYRNTCITYVFYFNFDVSTSSIFFWLLSPYSKILFFCFLFKFILYGLITKFSARKFVFLQFYLIQIDETSELRTRQNTCKISTNNIKIVMFFTWTKIEKSRKIRRFFFNFESQLTWTSIIISKTTENTVDS